MLSQQHITIWIDNWPWVITRARTHTHVIRIVTGLFFFDTGWYRWVWREYFIQTKYILLNYYFIHYSFSEADTHNHITHCQPQEKRTSPSSWPLRVNWNRSKISLFTIQNSSILRLHACSTVRFRSSFSLLFQFILSWRIILMPKSPSANALSLAISEYTSHRHITP